MTSLKLKKKHAHLKCEYTLALGMSCISVSVTAVWIWDKSNSVRESLSHSLWSYEKKKLLRSFQHISLCCSCCYSKKKNKLFFLLLIIPLLFESHLDHGKLNAQICRLNCEKVTQCNDSWKCVRRSWIIVAYFNVVIRHISRSNSVSHGPKACNSSPNVNA